MRFVNNITNYYRPQRSLKRLRFHRCLSVHRGVSAPLHAGIHLPMTRGRHPALTDTPPGSRHPPGSNTPRTRHSLGPDTPWEQGTPWGPDTSPGADIPPGADTPWSRHPQGADIPPPMHAGRYGQQAGGTHPTGMHTCGKCIDLLLRKHNMLFQFDIFHVLNKANISIYLICWYIKYSIWLNC